MPIDNRKHLRVVMLEESESDAALILRELHQAGWDIDARRVDSKDGLEGALKGFRPDVVLSAHAVKKLDFRTALRIVHSLCPHTPLIVVSGPLRGEDAGSCIRAGAETFISKLNLGRLGPAIAAALSERSSLKKLTNRQIEIMRLIADGRRTREIASELRVSAKTVESHRAQLMQRLGLRGMADLVRYAVRVGLANDLATSAEKPAVGYGS